MKYVYSIICLSILLLINNIQAQNANIIINEVSQGSNLSEYIELLVVGEPECNNIPCIDIRGWIIDDNDGGTYGGNGVASGCIRLSQDSYWECIPIGTMIVLYREGEPYTTLPPDDIYDSDNDCVHVIPFGPSTPTTLFEIHETMPNSGDPSYAPIGDAGWITTGYTWNVIGMRNGGDVIQIINPNTLSSVHAVAWGDDDQNPIVYINDGSASGNVYFMDNSVDDDPYSSLNWTTLGNSPDDETPGVPNTPANNLWITSMNYGCGTIDTLAIDSIFSDPTCGGCNGSVGVNFLGGLSPFNYNWDNGSTAESITNLCSGSFKVTVTDNNGCIDSTSVSVTSPVAFTATASTLLHESCDDANDGSVTVTTSGTTGTVTYVWSNGGSGTTQIGLADGIYSVTVTDGTGCFDVVSTTVNAGTLLDAINNNISGQCFTGNSFTFNGSGSESPNSCGAGCPAYYWDFGDGNSTSGTNAADLSPTHSYSSSGDYIVNLSVSDGICSSEDIITVSVHNEPTVSLTPTDLSCNGINDGNVIANPTGGTPNYNYNWSNSGGNTNSINNLSPGNYSVTVSDANNCTITSSATITEPTAITISENHTDALCNGGNEGSITITNSGGTSPYQFNWSNGSNTAFINNLNTGNYTITVSDNNNCITTQTIFIDEPSAIISTMSTSNTACNSNTGSASIAISGGNSPYDYLWNNSITTNTNSNLVAGNYTVTVTDNNNCSVTESTTINEENFVSVTINSTSNVTTPGGSDGAITINVSGGVPNYTYNWSNGMTTQNATDISAGNYCVTVYDVNLCSASICASITEPSNMQVTITASDLLCFGSSDGSISSTVIDGTSPYSYSWFSLPGNNNIGNNSNINNIPAGDYYLQVTDNSGYSINSTTITINQPAAISSNTIISNVACSGYCDGSIIADATGGTSPYNYEWSTLELNNQINNLCAGDYSLTITDNNNCTNEFTYTITEPQPFIANYFISDTLVCIGETIQLTASPTGGTLPYPSSPNDAIIWENAGSGLSGYGPHTLSPQGASETYSFTVFDANGCSDYTEITIQTPEPLFVSLPDTFSLCLGQDTEFCAEGSGGSDPSNYQFVWSNGIWESGTATSCQTVLETGTTTHRVILSDGCSPKDTAYTTIVVNPVPSISFAALNDEGCPPFSTVFSASSSIENTTFDWDMDGDGTIDTSGAVLNYTYYESGTYDVIVYGMSPDGCPITDSINNYIDIYPSPVVDFELTPTQTTIVNPYVNGDGTNTTGADSLLFWNFDDGFTDQGYKSGHAFIDEGTYEVSLTAYNSYGCFDSDTQTVVIKPSFTIYIPNAIVTTGDNSVNQFYPQGLNLDPDRYELFIFDRWGHVIFYTQDLNEHWDGRIKGSEQDGPEGVYVYKINTADINTGKFYEFVGHVTILK